MREDKHFERYVERSCGVQLGLSKRTIIDQLMNLKVHFQGLELLLVV